MNRTSSDSPSTGKVANKGGKKDGNSAREKRRNGKGQALKDELFPELKNKPQTKRPDKTESPTSKPDSQTSNRPSLLEELFPEVKERLEKKALEDDRYAKLSLPPIVETPPPEFKTKPIKPKVLRRHRLRERFEAKREDITVLALSNCSADLTAEDFYRIIPKAKHIEGWIRDGDLYKVIPARNPLTLERLQGYYLLFRSAQSALAYQRNASRLHKLAGLYAPTSIHDAIPPPKGFIEDGEDLNEAISRYCLAPPNLKLSLTMMLQPYHPWFRTLLQQGGYKGVVSPDKASRVLMHIEGYEPNAVELYNIFYRDGSERGVHWPIRYGIRGILRLRDVIRYTPKMERSNSSGEPERPGNEAMHGFNQDFEFNVNGLYDEGLYEESGVYTTNDVFSERLGQHIFGKQYNRWIVEFEEEDMARRFARVWHRRMLPRPRKETWKEVTIKRICNVELLW